MQSVPPCPPQQGSRGQDTEADCVHGQVNGQGERGVSVWQDTSHVGKGGRRDAAAAAGEPGGPTGACLQDVGPEKSLNGTISPNH